MVPGDHGQASVVGNQPDHFYKFVVPPPLPSNRLMIVVIASTSVMQRGDGRRKKLFG